MHIFEYYKRLQPLSIAAYPCRVVGGLVPVSSYHWVKGRVAYTLDLKRHDCLPELTYLARRALSRESVKSPKVTL